MGVPGVMLHVFGEDVRVAVNPDFSCLAGAEQRRLLGLCRETLDLALGGTDPSGRAAWLSMQPAADRTRAGVQ